MLKKKYYNFLFYFIIFIIILSSVSAAKYKDAGCAGTMWFDETAQLLHCNDDMIKVDLYGCQIGQYRDECDHGSEYGNNEVTAPVFNGEGRYLCIKETQLWRTIALAGLRF